MKVYANGRDAVMAVVSHVRKPRFRRRVDTTTRARDPSGFGALAVPPTRTSAMAVAGALIRASRPRRIDHGHNTDGPRALR